MDEGPVEVRIGAEVEYKLREGPQTTALSALHESEDNPRQITDERYDALKYSLERDPEMLKARPIIATPDGTVVCGNMRLRALLDLGWTEATVFVKELTPAQRREWMLRDNQEYGDWVPEDLATLIKVHADESGDLKLLGFTEGKVDNLLKLAEDQDSQADGGGNGDGAPAEVWGVIVECETEVEQADLIERLSEEGLSVRAVL